MRYLLLTAFSLGVILAAVAAAAAPPPNVGTRFALHVIAEPSGKTPPPVCPGEPDSADPLTNGLSCTQFTTLHPGNSYNWVYLVVGGADQGIDGVSFGVEYSGIFEPGYLSPSAWTLCSDGLDFPSTNPAWPASGSGMTLTWLTCQETPTYDYGIHAVVAKFYMYAYSGAMFKITPNLTKVSGPELDVNTCGKGTTKLLDEIAERYWDLLTGRIDFGGGYGFTPCIWDDTEPSTWGGLKAKFTTNGS